MPAMTASAAAPSRRIAAIDAMRGLIILIMTLDHARETFFLQRQVSDPMDLATTEPSLFFSRLAAHFCAPMFVFLTGLSAWLYANPPSGPRSPRGFLLKRGLFLIVLELVFVSFAWSGRFPPPVLYLQVIWVIGLSMIALALLHKLPLRWLALLGALIVAGHNALSFPGLEPGSLAHAAWTVLEQRGFLVTEGATRVKISYPLLAWIGVILLGYAAGPLFSTTVQPPARRRILLLAGAGCLLLLALLRGFNIYGEALPWTVQADLLHTSMSFLNLTKYPPSFNFLLMTLGVGMLALAWMEVANERVAAFCATFGAAPLFYYLAHLYLLLALRGLMAALSNGEAHQAGGIGEVWLWSVAVIAALYYPCRWFGHYKRTSGRAWVRYL
ncbi:DUF1624 domain-containing protein [Massilia scottii]|uniref:DUF1624 domain-containing protein n=1 Tax=Massilia scottii TaxID=3057166 RepID=UPI002796AC82|nr:heparan-alpha-glucosaminide N-acetyltransferase domain-containing protein [Massilia sp. CCM 9029]MDQ1833975.1 heparan-alpha-glucosaminide N-acetyltransferase domain-containing protein [Massilia sp. CCM 9029]